MSNPMPPPNRGGLGNTFKRPTLKIVLPSTAGEGMTRVVIDSTQLPEPLASYVWNDDAIPAQGSRYIAAIIFYGDAGDNNYSFIGFTKNSNPIFPFYQMHIGAVNNGAMTEITPGLPNGTSWSFVIGDPSPDLRQDNEIGQQSDSLSVYFLEGPSDGSTGSVFMGRLDWMTSEARNESLYFPYAAKYSIANAPLNLTAVNQDVPNLFDTIHAAGTFDFFTITATLDVASVAAPVGTIWLGELFVDGIAHPTELGRVVGTANGQSLSASQTWTIAGLAQGDHDIRIKARAGASGIYQIPVDNSTLNIQGYYGGQT